MSEENNSKITMEDIEIPCSWCRKVFIFNIKDQEFFKSKSFDNPKKCRDCNRKKKQLHKERGVVN